MALTKTTLNGAITAEDTLIRVTSGTGFAKGEYIKVDDEFMLQTADASTATLIPVMRGVNGTAAKSHVNTTNVVVGTGEEFTGTGDATAATYPLAGRQRRIVSYIADGAIALPSPGTDRVAVLNSTVALAMTLAIPTTDMDGDVLTIISNGKAAHTVTLATAVGDAGAGYTVGTFPSGGQTSLQFMACNAIWCSLPAPWAGTVTAIDVSIS